MRIIVSNSKNNHLLAPQFVDELLKNGYDVVSTYYIDITLLFSKYLIGRAILRLLPIITHLYCNLIFFKDVLEKKPDVIVIFKGLEIFPFVLKYFKRRNIFLVNYNLDHPFKFVSKASGNSNVLKNNPIYNLHLTYSKNIQKQLSKKYLGIKVAYLPFGYHSYVDSLELSGESINAVCFIGQADNERAKKLYFLSENGIILHLYGNGWSRYFDKNSLVKIFPSVSGKDYWKVLNKYRVQLNLLRLHNFDSHNMRTFEIPAAGGIMLANRTSEQVAFFKEDNEAFYFDTEEEFIHKIRKILLLSPVEVESIRIKAKRSASGNSYSDRAILFYKIIKTEYELFHSHLTTFNHSKRN